MQNAEFPWAVRASSIRREAQNISYLPSPIPYLLSRKRGWGELSERAASPRPTRGGRAVRAPAIPQLRRRRRRNFGGASRPNLTAAGGPLRAHRGAGGVGALGAAVRPFPPRTRPSGAGRGRSHAGDGGRAPVRAGGHRASVCRPLGGVVAGAEVGRGVRRRGTRDLPALRGVEHRQFRRPACVPLGHRALRAADVAVARLRRRHRALRRAVRPRRGGKANAECGMWNAECP